MDIRQIGLLLLHMVSDWRHCAYAACNDLEFTQLNENRVAFAINCESCSRAREEECQRVKDGGGQEIWGGCCEQVQKCRKQIAIDKRKKAFYAHISSSHLCVYVTVCMKVQEKISANANSYMYVYVCVYLCALECNYEWNESTNLKKTKKEKRNGLLLTNIPHYFGYCLKGNFFLLGYEQIALREM